METVRFTRQSLRRLKAAYLVAKEAGEEQFEFDGKPLLVSYAKYLIEYLESVLK